MDFEEQLCTKLSAVLTQLQGEGYRLPFHAAILAVNGSTLVGRYRNADGRGGLAFDTLVEHFEDEGFALPITLTIMDAEGRVSHGMIEVGSPRPLTPAGWEMPLA